MRSEEGLGTSKEGSVGATSFKDLRVWQKGMDLGCDVHRLTRLLPKEEAYRLTSQIIRASSSIPANIAEVMDAGPDATMRTSSASRAVQRLSLRPF